VTSAGRHCVRFETTSTELSCRDRRFSVHNKTCYGYGCELQVCRPNASKPQCISTHQSTGIYGVAGIGCLVDDLVVIMKPCAHRVCGCLRWPCLRSGPPPAPTVARSRRLRSVAPPEIASQFGSAPAAITGKPSRRASCNTSLPVGQRGVGIGTYCIDGAVHVVGCE
jgi:hypothetical protein